MSTGAVHRFIYFAASFVGLLSLTVVFGWLNGIDGLLRIMPGLPSMKFNTALGLLLTSISLFSFQKTKPLAEGVFFSAIFVVFLIGSMTVSEYVFDADLRIDQLLVKDIGQSILSIPHPGRMSATTATCFLLFSISLCILRQFSGKITLVSQYCLHGITIISFLSMISYAYNIPITEKMWFFRSMAVHTSACFFLLSIAASLLKPELGFTGFVRGYYSNNWLARRLFPQFAILISVVGFIRILIFRYQLVSEQSGILLTIVTFLLMSLILIVVASKALTKVENERNLAQNQLLELNQELEVKVKERSFQLLQVSEKLELASESAHIGLWTFDVPNRFFDCNDSVRTIWGFGKEEEVTLEKMKARAHPDDQKIVNEAFIGDFKNGERTSFEHRIVRPDGSQRWIRVTGVIYKDGAGKQVKIAGAHIDITDQKIAELNLIESNKRSQLFIEQAPTAIAMFDKELNYLAASEQWREDFGLTAQDLLSRPPDKVLPETGDDWSKIFEECMKGSVFKSDEASFKTPAGSVRWFEWDIRPWYVSPGEIGGLVMYTADLTELKKKEAEREKIERILKNANKVAKIATWEMEIGSGITVWSAVANQIYGLPDDFIATREAVINTYTQESREKLEDGIVQLEKNGTPFDLELEVRTTSDYPRWVRLIGEGEFQSGICVRRFGTVQDISSIKKAEMDWRLSEEQFRGAFQYSAIGMALISLDGNWINVNGRLCQMLGYSGAELMELTFRNITHPEDLDIDFELASKLLSGEIDNYNLEKRYLHKLGTIIWVQLNVSLLKDLAGNPIHFISQVKDITERKATEAALKEERQLLKSLIDNIPVNVYIKDLESRKTLANRLEMEYLGVVEESEVLGKTDFDLYPEETAKTSIEEDIQVISTGTPIVNRETFNKKNDGSEHWFLTSKIPFYNENGEITGLIGISYNITNRKIIERALEESEQRWQFALDGSGEGVWDWKIQTGEVFFSDKAMQIIGLSNNDHLLTADKWDDLIHPDDRHSYYLKMEKHLEGETDVYTNELRVKHAHGHYVWILDRGKAVEFDEKGTPTRAIGTHTDISWRKEKEEEIRHSFDIISEQNKRLLNFAHIVSHNLRSHSGNLEMMINLINISNSQDEKNELIQRLSQISGGLSETIRNLNEVVKIQIDINTQKEQLNLKEYFEKSIQILSGDIKEKNAQINLNFPDDLSIKYNKAYLESIILNFLSNGIKYRHPDRNPVINIDFFDQNNIKFLQIVDNGLGIDLDRHKDKIFGMYKTFHGNSDAKGIGLFITKNQVESMGGRIEVESKVGNGTTFKIYF